MKNCPDCGVAAGEEHVSGCDVEKCPNCGEQAISCDCDNEQFNQYPRLPWTGVWPGSEECIEFGWYARWEPNKPGHRYLGKWVRCEKDDPGAVPDLNRLHAEAHWNAELRRFVRKGQST